MTKDEIKRKIKEDFHVVVEENPYPESTDTELMSIAKKIAEKLGLTETFYCGKE